MNNKVPFEMDVNNVNMEETIREDEYVVIVECGNRYSYQRGWKKTLDRWDGITFTLKSFEGISEDKGLITDVRVIEGCMKIE